MFRKKTTRAAHIKKNTVGTSNELSFSVLDAVKNELDEEQNSTKKAKKNKLPRFGAIALFTLPGKRKTVATPTKPEGLHLSTGEFVSVDGQNVEDISAGVAVAGTGVALGGSGGALGGSGGALGASVGVTGVAAGGVAAGDAGGESKGASCAGEGTSASLSASTSAATSLATGASTSFAASASLSTGTGTHVKGKKNKLAAHAKGVSFTQSTTSLWTSPQDEVKRRKAKRFRRRVLIISLLVVALVAGLSFLGWKLYSSYTIRQSYTQELHSILDKVESTDNALVDLDNAVSDLIESSEKGTGEVPDEQTSATYNKILKEANKLDSTFKEAAQKTSELLEVMPDSVDKEAATQTALDIEARQNMIKEANTILADGKSASLANTSANAAWNKLLEADSSAREAAELVASATQDNVTTSIEKSSQAISGFSEAKDLFNTASAAYPAADFSQYMQYLDKRIEALGYAVASNEAVVARNKEEAATQNDAYTQADALAVEMAKLLPTSPSVTIASASAQTTAKNRESYNKARAQAASADAFLRDYLGGTSK